MVGVISLYFLYFLLAQLVFYFAGNFILKWLGYEATGFYASFFDKCLAGLIASVFLFSVVASSGKTIQWAILLVALFVWKEVRISGRKNAETRSVSETAGGIFQKLLPLFILAILVYGWFAYHTFNWHSDFMYAMPHKDKVYYTNISNALVEFGNENRQGAYSPKATDPVTEPYHYFDLWFTSILSFFTSMPSAVVVSLLCLPICALIAISGVLSVFEKKGGLKLWHFVMAFLLLFIRGIYLEIHDPQIAWAENFSEGILEFKSEKLGVLYIFGILSFRFLLNGNLLAALVSLLIFPVVSIGNLPGVVGGLLLFVLITWIGKGIRLIEAFRAVAYCTVVSAFIYLFYRFTGDPNSNVYLEKGLLVFTDIDSVSLQSVKVATIELFVRIMNNPWRAVLMHLPFLLIAWMAIKEDKQYRRAFLLIACIYFVSLAAYGFFYKLADAPQFYTNNLPLLNIFMIIGAALFLVSSSYNQIVRASISVGLAGILDIMLFFSLRAYNGSRSFTELYSDKYLCTIDSVHKGITEKTGVAILYDPSQQPDLYNCDMSGPNLLFLPFFPKFRVPVDLNIFENRNLTWGGEMGEIQKRFINRAPFHRYVLQQMAAGTYHDIGASQIEYLKSEHIRYLFVSRGIDPDHRIVALVRKRIKDERSGEKLLILNNEP